MRHDTTRRIDEFRPSAFVPSLSWQVNRFRLHLIETKSHLKQAVDFLFLSFSFFFSHHSPGPIWPQRQSETITSITGKNVHLHNNISLSSTFPSFSPTFPMCVCPEPVLLKIQVFRTENKEGVSKERRHFPHQEMQQSLQKEQHASQYRCFFRKPRSHSASDFASSASLNVRPVVER